MSEIVNRVANSGIITYNLEKLFPSQPIVEIDLKKYLFKELILREKDYRTALKEEDWTRYQDKNVCVFCSVDVVIPTWAYMLIGSYLQEVAHGVYFGTKEDFLITYYRKVIENLDIKDFENERVILKGCSNKPVPQSAYLDMTVRLKPIVKSLMFGEACSAVPIYKKSIALSKK